MLDSSVVHTSALRNLPNLALHNVHNHKPRLMSICCEKKLDLYRVNALFVFLFWFR